MRDQQSQIFSNSKYCTKSRHRTTICVYCCKLESSNYDDRARKQQRGQKQEWVERGPLLDGPWCTNWKEIIADPTLNQLEPIQSSCQASELLMQRNPTRHSLLLAYSPGQLVYTLFMILEWQTLLHHKESCCSSS